MEDLLEMVVRPVLAGLRFLVLDIGVELLIKRPGWLLKKYLWPPHWHRPVDADDWPAVVLGLAFWLVLFSLYS
jgi:hypothetical protein